MISFAAGIVFLMLIVLTAVSVSAIRRIITWRLRLPFLILIVATLTTLFDMVLTAWFYDLRNELGIYMPLLAFNSLVFAVSEEYFLKYPVRESLVYALQCGMNILLIFIVTGAVRELLIYGSLLRDAGLVTTGQDFRLDLINSDRASGLSIIRGAPGAFICLGLILGLWKFLTTPGKAAVAEKKRIE